MLLPLQPKNTLVYTFSWFPGLHLIPSQYKTFIFSQKLKADFLQFAEVIKAAKPNLIVGLAKSWTRRSSYIEKSSQNVFHKKNIIEKNGESEFSLAIPTPAYPYLKIHEAPDDTFCNYLAYKTAYFANKQDPNIKTAFIHIRNEEICELFGEM